MLKTSTNGRGFEIRNVLSVRCWRRTTTCNSPGKRHELIRKNKEQCRRLCVYPEREAVQRHPPKKQKFNGFCQTRPPFLSNKQKLKDSPPTSKNFGLGQTRPPCLPNEGSVAGLVYPAGPGHHTLTRIRTRYYSSCVVDTRPSRQPQNLINIRA